MTEKEIEAELEIEVRDLPSTDGRMRPVHGYRFMWRDFDTVVSTTNVDPLDILEVARVYEEDHSDPFQEALALAIEYFRQKYVLGIE